MKESDYLENLGVDGRIISKWIFRKCNRVRWRALEQTALNLRAL